MHLSKHQRAQFTCPPEYAYGSQGAGNIIPADTTLLFHVELLEINPTITEEERNTQANNGRPKKKKKRRSVFDLPPVGDPRDHMCFNPVTIYSALGLLATSFVYLLYACNKKVQHLTKERRRELRKKVA